MGWLSVLVGVVASVLFYRSEASGLTWLSIGFTIVNFWAYGVMHNHAVESAKRRASYTGGFYDLTEKDLHAVPNRLATVNMVTTVVLVGLLVTGLVFAF